MMPSIHIKDMIFWSVLIYAFAGCETASFMGGEIKNPRRAIPLGAIHRRNHSNELLHPGNRKRPTGIAFIRNQSLEGLMQAVTKTASRVGYRGHNSRCSAADHA